MDLKKNSKTKNEKKKSYKLNLSSTELINQCYVYITNFLFALRNDQELMFKIIQKAPLNPETEKCFSLFIMNNFYENILSPSYIEEELLALIERSLNYEINLLNPNNAYNNFLEKTATGFLLGGLISKNDVKSYFNMLLKNIIEKMENKNKQWNFTVYKIAEYVSMKKKKEKEMKEKKTKNKTNNNYLNDSSLDFSILKSNNKEQQEEENFFYVTYISDLKIKDLKEKMKNLNEDMKIYIQKQIDESENNEDIYSNSRFLESVYNSSDPNEVLNYYQKDFMNCIEIIKDIFNSLNQYIHLVPFSVKCICKIISILIKRKFKNISKIEINAFIGKFFFEKLFNPIIRRPDYNALITSFIISKQTRNNINYICEIIKYLFSGKFIRAIKDSNYTPFNYFFLYDSMPLAIEFFDKIINVNLPPYIDKLINDPDNDNYNYNFFEENKNEFALQKSICFSIQDFLCLFNIVKENKEFFIQTSTCKDLKEEKLKKNSRRVFGLTIDKLSIKVHTDRLKAHLEKEREDNITNFYLKSEIIYNKKFSELINIQQKKTMPSLNIPELKELNSEEDIIKNNLIKIENCFSTLLFNYRILNESDFSIGTTENTISILNEILKFLKTGSFVLDNTIPTDWYVHTLLKLLKIIPDKYKENDYELIYENLINNLNDSIKTLDFAELSQIFERLKYTERAFKNLNKNLISINEIETNNIIKNFVENHKLEVEIKMSFQNRKFEITRSNSNNEDSRIYEDFSIEDTSKNKKKTNIYRTIFEFTNKFPPFINFQQKQGYDLFEIEQEFHLPEQLENYFKFVKEEMKKSKLFSHLKEQKEFQTIYFNITNYIMIKLYDKIFPSEPDINDIQIYHNSVRLSWIEPYNLIKNNNYSFENFLPETKELILRLDSEKCPLKKIACLNEVSSKISNIIAFNNGGDFVGVDDTLPIFQFAVIKAQPNKFYSNFKYMSMFLNKEFRSGPKDHLISQMSVIGEFIKAVTYDKLNDVTQEDFKYKCEQAIKIDFNI